MTEKKVLDEKDLNKVSGGSNSWDGHIGQKISPENLGSYINERFIIKDIYDAGDPDEGILIGFDSPDRPRFRHASPQYEFTVPVSWNEFYLYK